MGSISLTMPTAGTVITAGLHASNYTTIQTLVNGQLDSTNLKSNAGILPGQISATTVYTVLASGATISPGAFPNVVVFVTGTTSITTVTPQPAGSLLTISSNGQAAGIPLVLNYGTASGGLVLRDNKNVGLYAALNGVFIGESVSFICNGSQWAEISRNLVTVLDYQQITANVALAATTEATANTCITSSAITFDGATPMLFEVFSPVLHVVSASTTTVLLHDGAAVLGDLVAAAAPGGGGGQDSALRAVRRYTPPNASKTHTVRGFSSGGAGIFSAGAGGAATNMPAFLRISRDL